MSFLKIENINKSYGNEEILNNINLEFDIGEFVCRLGPSGCGKSTLLNLIGLIDEPSNGFVYLNNRKIANRERQKYRYSYYGYIYQNYNLLEYMDVEENIKLSRLFNESNPKEITKVLESLEIEGYKNTNINLLSGGEKQRVDIARCLYKNPKIILADEPTGSLDESLADNIMSTLKNNSSNHLIIMVTHNEELALKYATRIIRLNNHGIIEDTKLIETELIDHSENNRPYKSIGLFKHIKNTLKSYKTRSKVSLTLIAVFTLVFLLIQGIDSITNGFNYYNSYLINNRLDRDYINVEYLLEGYSIETILKTNKIEYKKESNYDFICNYYLKEYIAITNNIDFDFEVSCIDFELINTEKIDQNSYLIVNSLFKDKYENNNIQFSYNSTILGKIVSFNKDYYIDYIYNEGSIFNNPKIYINTKVIEELLSTEIIDYIYNEQDLYTIPERYFIISGYSTLYKLLSSYEGCSNYLNNNISSKTEFVYENSTDILRSTFSSLIDSASKILYLVMILVCFGVIKLTSLTLEYSIKSRNKELGLYLSFGLKNKDLLNIILSENIILLIPSLGISFGLSYILSILINSNSKTLLKQNFSFDIYKINNLGFFISVMLLLLILMIASSSSYSKLKKFEIKEVLAYE